MQRDIANEVIVAIVAIGVLAVAIAFGIILSLSSRSDETALVATPSEPAAAETLATVAASLEAVESTPESLPSATTTASEVPATATSSPTVTASPTTTSSPTALPPTHTPTPTASQTPRPSATFTNTPQPVTPTATLTLTRTPLPAPSATVTATARPSATPTPTVTLSPTQKPSSTPRPSATPTATFTQTPTATLTRTPSPTATFTATARPSATPTPTATRTPSPTATPTVTLTRTPLPTRTPVPPTPTPTWTASPIPACSQPPGWIVYVIQRGDTLTSIASTSGTTVENLQQVNCLTNANSITVGQTIFIPGAAPTATSGWVVQGCTDPSAVITNLTPGQTVTGVVSIQGTAWLDRFGYYKIEIRPDSIQTYTLYNRYPTPVVQGELAQIDTSIFTPGLYWLQLTVVQTDERFAEPCAIPLIFQR